MKGVNKTKAAFTVSLLIAIISSGYSKDGRHVGIVGSVNNSTKEIIVNTLKDKTLELGEQVYVRINGKVTVMKTTFPMMTTSKCALEKQYIKQINNMYTGMSVYKYETGVEEPGDGLSESKYRPAMIPVKGGTFQMGQYSDAHKVTLSDYLMSTFEVRQVEYNAVMGPGNSMSRILKELTLYSNKAYPAFYISWYEAIVFCNKLSIIEGRTPCYTLNGTTNPAKWGKIPLDDKTAVTWDSVICNWSADGYRLPTEAEWEYAARGGAMSKNYKYCGSNLGWEVAVFKKDFNVYGEGAELKRLLTIPGLKLPNELGIHTMSGYAAEWCWDYYSNNYFKNSPQIDPRGPEKRDMFRVCRGGAIDDNDANVYSRRYYAGSYTGGFTGVRLVRSK